MRKSNNTWTGDEIHRLTFLWSQGKSANEIAKQFPGKSRNSIIGKAHRLGLQKRPSPIPTKPRSVAPYFNPSVNLPAPPVIEGVKKHHTTIRAEERKARRSSLNIKAFAEPKRLDELKRDECRWPIGETPRMLFCSAKIGKGAYCDKHHSISIRGKHETQ